MIHPIILTHIYISGRLLPLYEGRTVWLGPGDVQVRATETPSPGVQVPDPPPAAPPGLDKKMELLLSWGKYAVMICGLAGLFLCAGQMAIGRKNRSTFAADGATGVPWVLGGLSLAVTAASVVGVFFSK
ncbi:hypothetical protein J4573_08630 [Actinomadura barringtoniae]|uniref:Uncharacterized protein n=1 Tax=Actinomadura barringtoniae TaxID=1427535 RepID=A0A939PCI9_9ACTN|nr:hypothetical protein [Actinomadura barringtoniae]MBO2447149.1 hypothetical protein [Actinomadura barringtoniae]